TNSPNTRPTLTTIKTTHKSTLLPYTTLFRSKEGDARGVKSDNKIYRYDGSNWIDIAEISLNPISEVDDRLSSKLREKVNYQELEDRKSTRLNSSHVSISYAVLCLKKKIKSIY